MERAASRTWENAKKRALRNGKELRISKDQVFAMLQDFCSRNHHDFSPKNPFQPSLDRIDHKGLYEESNLRVVWLIENYARNTFTDEQVIEFCKRKLGQL